MKTSVDSAKLIRPPRRVILGKKTRGRLTDVDVFCDFLEAFCHVSMERCSPTTLDWPTTLFGPVYEVRKCPDIDFQNHVIESCQLAKQYLTARRIYAFEVSMVTASEKQIISFRICMSQLEFPPDSERVRNIYASFSQILESVRNLEIPESVDTAMSSTKYRPRIRLLARLRPESERKADTSKSDENGIALPLGDSIFHFSNLLSFYAHM